MPELFLDLLHSDVLREEHRSAGVTWAQIVSSSSAIAFSGALAAHPVRSAQASACGMRFLSSANLDNKNN